MLAGSEVDRCFEKTSLHASEEIRYTHASVYSILTVLGSVLNVLLLVVIRTEWKRLSESNFYSLVICLCCSSLVYLIPNYIIMIPCTASKCEFYADWILIVFAAFNTVGYYSALFATFAITVERFALFFFLKIHFFLSRHLWKIVALVWLGGAAVLVFTVGLGCFKRFNRHTFQYTFFCSECGESSAALADGLFVLGQSMPGLMLAAYAAIFLKVLVNRKHSNVVSRAVDCRLAFQFTVICTFQWFSAFFFFMVPRVFGTTQLGVMAMNVCGIVNTAVNPIVLFVFNSRMKHGFSRRLRFRRSTVVSSLHIQSNMTQTPNAGPWATSTAFPLRSGSVSTNAAAY